MGQLLERGRRARREDDKRRRRRDILDAAWALLSATPYPEVTMAAVADRAGLAKGTAFLYFRTKEGLFLALAAERLDAWFADLDAGLEAERTCDAGRLARLVCDTVGRHPGLGRLLAVLHGVLERNVDLETARAFKRGLLGHVTRTGALLERTCPFLAPGAGGPGGAVLLLRVHALAVGIAQMADPPPVVAAVLGEPGMEIFRVDPGPMLEETLAALLRGLEQTRSTP
ncbi:MAG TPA: TetR family transcriptional regulator [Actinomycetes bacterium]|nr:TetR family transcriptional regulator [Actinomycetes bacterium]